MGKTHRFDPYGDDDNSTTLSKTELKRQRRARKQGKEAIIDQHMTDDEGGDPILNGVMAGGWDKF